MFCSSFSVTMSQMKYASRTEYFFCDGGLFLGELRYKLSLMSREKKSGNEGRVKRVGTRGGGRE